MALLTQETREIGIKVAEHFFRKMEDPTFAEIVVLQQNWWS